ncbi:MAG: bifunctional transaldolase/phosoglucose isomerase [Deferrisomatales bacterium]
MSRLQELAGQGQAVWYDYIRRSFLRAGELEALVDQGVRGVTSNPSIFEKAIAGSSDYDVDLERLARRGLSVEEIYEDLAIDDIRSAARVLRRVYDDTDGLDGYVSLEVSPALAHDTRGTVAEARRLFGTLALPNAMIKVPATPEGIPAVATLIGEGVNVNVTLIFSVAQYEAVAEAYLTGLERLASTGARLGRVASVASFFVSRLDTALDPVLEARGRADLCGSAAVDNARLAYARFTELFRGPRWEALAARGARVQRPLWASTGTKNPAYPDTLYVDQLIGPHTVNTVPPATLQAFLEHGRVERTVDRDTPASLARLEELRGLGIDLEVVTERLLAEGVAAFARSFETLLGSIEDKRARLGSPRQAAAFRLGPYRAAVDRAWEDLRRERVMQRIWEHDHTVWKPDPAEISNRLGWLRVAQELRGATGPLQDFSRTVAAEGTTHALLLGMGGSSLAPEVFRKTFGVAPGGVDLAVLDTTDPEAVLARAEALDPAKTLFLVSTKSGGTVETLSLFRFFYERTAAALGRERAGARFAAVTDPGSSLADLAREHGFRNVFLSDPDIGGRYSALSPFGLLPAALVGVDVELLLERALTAAANADGCNCPVEGDNHAARLGAALGELALAGRDKATFFVSPAVEGFGDWVEQLLAESTGKEGRGLLPVVGEPPGPPEFYGDDRIFLHLRLDGDSALDGAVADLERAGHPVIRLALRDPYDLGGQFFLWEMATAVAGWRLAIHPFDQPDVEAAKVLARELLAAYRADGRLPEAEPAFTAEGIRVYGDARGPSPGDALASFLRGGEGGAYVALQAYLPPSPAVDRALGGLRAAVGGRTGLATTVGYGPRYLHSTGQLHKGDAGRGLFVQLTADPARDAPIPDPAGTPGSPVTFGVLEAAQALGDRRALLDRGRRVLRLHLGPDPASSLGRLARALG